MTDDKGYLVLARKYRPQIFADLIGQEAMVRTLANAFEADRIAHAFIMTGVRGVGKTTTARIIAKGLNCIGEDGKGGPTITPCGVCEHCAAISDGRHVDVLEMDAASRTGVNDIREIIDSVAYRAASARYKVYIIDEVHMLSTSAFNALLKTLEEPPAHVKFIFATTEIRKVPVTVLSRCQRFDLRRIEPEVMIAFLMGICQKEEADIEEKALALITRAAEGSVRDALSLLDQAIAHGGGKVTPEMVRDMLGLADRGRVLDLFDYVMSGDAAKALSELGSQYAEGADPLAVLRDLSEVTHWISVAKISPELAEDPTLPPDQRQRGMDFAARLSMRPLTRLWQMLLKALDEVASAPNAMMAAEMALIRMTHIAELPSPEELVKKFDRASEARQMSSQSAPSQGGGGSTSQMRPAQGSVMPAPQEQSGPKLAQFEDVLMLIRQSRDIGLLIEIEHYIRLASYAPGVIEFTPTEDAPQDLASKLSMRLKQLTGIRWSIVIVPDCSASTISELRAAEARSLHALAEAHPVVQMALARFPGSHIKEVRPDPDMVFEFSTSPDEGEEEWDPFEEES